jgi:hypothetical protein
MSLVAAFALAAAAQSSAVFRPAQQVTRMEIAGDGELLSCTNVNRGAFEGSDDFCELVRSGPSARRLQMRGGTGSRPVVAVSELAVNVEGTEPYQAEHARPGRRVIALARGTFEISERGKVENCRPVEARGDPMLQMPVCRLLDGSSFTPRRGPDGAPLRSRGEILGAFSVEEAAPD